MSPAFIRNRINVFFSSSFELRVNEKNDSKICATYKCVKRLIVHRDRYKKKLTRNAKLQCCFKLGLRTDIE